MLLLGDYWRTGHCCCNVEIRKGALTVAILTMIFAALSIQSVSVNYGIPALIGLTTGSLAAYAYRRGMAWAYIPLAVQYGISAVASVVVASVMAIYFFVTFSKAFEDQYKPSEGQLTLQSLRLVLAVSTIASLIGAFVAHWFMRIVYGAYRWQKEEEYGPLNDSRPVSPYGAIASNAPEQTQREAYP